MLLLLAGCAPTLLDTRSPPATAPESTPPSASPTAPEPTWPDPVAACADPDASLTFDPPQPPVGAPLRVSVTAPTGYVWIGMASTPDLAVTASAIEGSGPFTWWFDYALPAEGRYDFAFTADSGVTPICTGSVWSFGTAPPETTTSTASTVDAPPANPVGIGLVSPGSASQWDLAASLAGRGGHVRLVFPSMVPGMTGPDAAMVDAVQGLYDRDLVPVLRLSPPWGQNHVRGWSDPGQPTRYTDYAQSFANVIAGLPRRGDWPLWVEVMNEPNLCYEWTCDAGEVGGDWLTSTETAAEYAGLLHDVADALHALGDARVKVVNAGLAPGGAASCQCGGEGWTGGETSLDFVDHVLAADPTVFAALDGFASHSYPMNNPGWDFFLDYPQSGLGLHWWEQEVAEAGIPSAPVLITETGWTVGAGDFPSRDQVADRTVLAWQNDWYGDPQLAGVMPFQLQDPSWDDFAWVDGAGAPYPVFDAVRSWRCGLGFPDPC